MGRSLFGCFPLSTNDLAAAEIFLGHKLQPFLLRPLFFFICLHVFVAENNMLTFSFQFLLCQKNGIFSFFSNPCESPNPGIYLATFCLFVITKEEFGGRP